MGAFVHHSAIVASDIDASIRFWREGLGFIVLMDHEFEGDWPTLFGAPSTHLRSVFLGDPANSAGGVVELVHFGSSPAVPDEAAVSGGAREVPVARSPGRGLFLLSVNVNLDAVLARLARLALGSIEGRIEVPGPRGPVGMATVRDPDGVLVELIDQPSV